MREKRILPDNAGFSLVELLVVIAVIAVLAAIIIPTVSSIRVRAASSRDVAHLRQLHGAWIMASNENGGYVIMGRMPSPEAYRRHWPGWLADQFNFSFPGDEYSVYLDYPEIPESTVFSPGGGYDYYDNTGRKKVAYGINIVAVGTKTSNGAIRPAEKGNGDILADSNGGGIHPPVERHTQPGDYLWHGRNRLSLGAGGLQPCRRILDRH